MEHLRGEDVRGLMPESYSVELDEKWRQKWFAFLEGVLTTDPPERIGGGKADW